jgi:hypothetical protein
VTGRSLTGPARRLWLAALTGITAAALASTATALFISSDGGEPVAVADTVGTALDTPVDVDVLANDSDPDGEPLSLIAVGAPAHGTATFAGGLVTYTPAPGFEGVDHLLYTISDGDAHTATGLLSVYVGVPLPPPPVLTVSPAFLDFGTVAVNKTKDLVVTVTNDTEQPVALSDFYVVDQAAPHPFDMSDYEGCRSPFARVLEPGQSCTQKIRFWSVPGADAASAATARLFDGVTFETTLATLAFFGSVGPPDNGPNLPPAAVDDLAGVAPGVTHVLDPTRNDSDPDDDRLRITAVSDPPHGTAAIVSCGALGLNPNADCVRYAPDDGYTGTDAFAYAVSDGRGGTASATYHLAVGNVVPRVDAMTPSIGPPRAGRRSASRARASSTARRWASPVRAGGSASRSSSSPTPRSWPSHRRHPAAFAGCACGRRSAVRASWRTPTPTRTRPWPRTCPPPPTRTRP